MHILLTVENIDGGPWCKIPHPKTGKEIILKDVIADTMFQQILLRPEDYIVMALPNLNGDYISDAAIALIGSPGANE